MRIGISGIVLDGVTRAPLSTPRVSLTQRGVLGETVRELDQDGHFSFGPLSPGKYCLGLHHDRYAPLYREFDLGEGVSIEAVEIALTPAAFIAGKIIDEDGLPPHRCHFTLIRLGDRRGRSGYISDSGAHTVGSDGSFSSPPLNPGRYGLRFAGILRRTSGDLPQSDLPAMQQRIFDFVYPNVQEAADAVFFEVRSGQRVKDLDVRIPRPIWRMVRGKLTGRLPNGLTNIYVHFTRDVGMIDDFGSLGAKVDSRGAFECTAQPGRYKLVVCEMSSPDAKSLTQMTMELGSTEIAVGTDDLNDLEIAL